MKKSLKNLITVCLIAAAGFISFKSYADFWLVIGCGLDYDAVYVESEFEGVLYWDTCD